MPRKRPPCRASHVSRAPQPGQVGRVLVGLVDRTAGWAGDPVGLHRSHGMPPHRRRCTLAVRVQGGLCNVASVVPPFASVAEGIGVLERIGVHHLLNERNTSDQMDQILGDLRDADPPGLVLSSGRQRPGSRPAPGKPRPG